MKCIIAGSRVITGNLLIHEAIEQSGFKHDITEVVCGGALGADDIGDAWAFERGIPVMYFIVRDTPQRTNEMLNRFRNKRPVLFPEDAWGLPPDTLYPYHNIRIASDWQKDGKPAGPIRNRAMAEYADALIAVHDTRSTGTGTPGMIRIAQSRGLRVHVLRYDGP